MSDYSKSKIKKKEMIEEIKEELIIYFRKGLISTKTFFNIDDIKFKNIYDILKIHFILSEEVQDYTLNLEKDIRNIKNSTELHKKLFHGEVRGNIDWNKTIEYRTNTFHKDKTKFICDNVDKLYDIKENLVLKKAISTIYNIIYLEIGMNRFHEKEWFKNGEEISKIISNIYKKNIYIKRIDISDIEITDKMILDVSKSRNKIYRDSAKILKLYRDVMKLDEKEVGKLFSSTFIELEDENKVFELYSIFKYLRKNFPIDKLKYNILDKNEECLAKIEDDTSIYRIYHDSVGKDDISFNIGKNDIVNSRNLFLERKIEVLNRKNLISKELNRVISNSIWSGRPDLLIVQTDKTSNNIVKISIGEIKYTNNESYMFKGLEELLDYMYLVRDGNGLYIDSNSIEGLLFVDNIKLEKQNFRNVKIINRDSISEHDNMNSQGLLKD